MTRDDSIKDMPCCAHCRVNVEGRCPDCGCTIVDPSVLRLIDLRVQAALTAPAASGEALDSPKFTPQQEVDLENRGFMRENRAPTPQPGPVGRVTDLAERGANLHGYGYATEARRAYIRGYEEADAAANKRVEAVTKAARVLVDSQWEHRCADKVGGCTAVNSVLLDALDAATREGREG